MPRPKLTLSILVPVYNEAALVALSLERLRLLAKRPELAWTQVVVVDDGSSDNTAQVLKAFARRAPKVGRLRFEFHQHQANQGKGAAVRTALGLAKGQVSLIHDADLEYHPSDIPRLLEPFLSDQADAVYGSRFQPRDYRRVLHFRHQLGNWALTFFCNVLSDYNLTDMETCYKAIRTDLFRDLGLVSQDFRLEPEITMKLARHRARLYEVPINYSGRGYEEGKKIGWFDGVLAILAIVRFMGPKLPVSTLAKGSQGN